MALTLNTWLARTLGQDLSDDFARYLFRAGQLHAAHGPRRVHVPEIYVTGAISLVNATFARFLAEEMPGAAIVPAALAGWNKLSGLLHATLLSVSVAKTFLEDYIFNIFSGQRREPGHPARPPGRPGRD
jgi:hypothetical protein